MERCWFRSRNGRNNVNWDFASSPAWHWRGSFSKVPPPILLQGCCCDSIRYDQFQCLMFSIHLRRMNTYCSPTLGSDLVCVLLNMAPCLCYRCYSEVFWCSCRRDMWKQSTIVFLSPDRLQASYCLLLFENMLSLLAHYNGKGYFKSCLNSLREHCFSLCCYE